MNMAQSSNKNKLPSMYYEQQLHSGVPFSSETLTHAKFDRNLEEGD
jgi:hypothetical protein